MKYSIRYGSLTKCFKRAVWICVLFLLIDRDCLSQSNSKYFFRHITQEDGLLHNNVYDIVQDKRGFIWIATANGLQRYDGNRFINFRGMLNSPSGATSGTPSLGVDTIRNMLWINQSVFAEKLNMLNQRITFYSPDKLFDSLSSRSEVYKDKNGVSYLISASIIFQYDSLHKKYKVLSQSTTPFAKGISSNHIVDSLKKQVWMGSNTDGLTLFDAKTGGVYTASYNPIHNPVLEACWKEFGDHKIALRRILIDSHNNLWMATWRKEFYQYQWATGKLMRYSLTSIAGEKTGKNKSPSPQAVSCFYEDNHHTIWLSAENMGLLTYHPTNNQFHYIAVNDKNEQSEPYNYNIFCIYQDREENIWLGTDKGITLFNPYRQNFQSIHHEETGNSLPKSEIECYMQMKDGDILAGTWGGGITLFDSNWTFKKNIRFPNTPFEKNLVWNFVQNDDGTIWAGCQHGYIHIYHSSDFIQTIHPPEMGNSTIRCIAKDGKNNIWFGLHNGKIAEWNNQQQRFYSYNDSNQKEETAAPVTFIFFDKQQRCWVSTEGGGLKEFDTNKRHYIAAYPSSGSNSQSLISNTTEGDEQLNDSTLIIATLHSGLFLYSIRTKAFTRFTPANDMRFNNTYAVKKDAGGDVWFTTDYGLFKWQQSNKKFIQYHLPEGILNAAFKAPSFYSLHNGKWATSTAMEIVVFSPQKMMSAKPSNHAIEITGVSVFDKPLLIDSLLLGHHPLHLSYQQNFLTIEFATLSFTNVHQTDYYYRLQGVDKDWVYADAKAFATYTNLPPGSYQFEVKGEDDGGTTAITLLPIIIEPPFWKRGWFLLLATLCIGSAVYLLMRWRIKNIRAVESEKRKVQQAKIETLSLQEKLSSAKLQALQSQMNPHFIFNCLNSIDNLIQTGEKEKATTYLAKFAKLIRSVLETSSSNTVPCWKDIETMKIYLQMEALRCDHQFVYHIQVSDEIMNGDYKVPPLVIQPFLENAIHHGLLNKREKDKSLCIEVSVQNQSIHYIIEDNGVGRAKAEEYKQLNRPSHHSMGLQISTDRIHLFNGNSHNAIQITDLYNEKHAAAGTRVEVNITNQS